MKDCSHTQEDESPRPCRSLLRIRKRKYKTIRQCHQKKGNKKKGRWHLGEAIKYIEFIKQNIQKLRDQDTRRKERVFALMAGCVGSRTAVQCRSHHQKMRHLYGDPENIVSHFEANVIPYYSAKLETWQKSLKPIIAPAPFCIIIQTGNYVRLELNPIDIQSF